MKTTFASAINDGLRTAMRKDEMVICYGLGVPDPKGVFGTTLGLAQEFGSQRVFDMPTSENAMTGVAVGAALDGIKSVVTHQRLDFFLLAMDQLVNSASKWHYMFGGGKSVPITIRLILGRGWGQGPTHSQNLQAWFAHVPGLKVVMPTTPGDAKGLLLASIFDPNPVVFLEHRWLHNMEGEVPEGDYRIPLGSAHLVRKGSHVTIVAMSYMTVEALHASDFLQQFGIFCDVIDLRTVKPLDWHMVFSSVEKTGRLIALDSGFATCSIAAEVIARVALERFDCLKAAPIRLAMPDIPEPTSPALTKGFYVRAREIAESVARVLGRTDVNFDQLKEPEPHDVPGDWFRGPF
jgi:acetoin:2,6-dichlorophenolindophenol oxidoreductase subunit beta